MKINIENRHLDLIDNIYSVITKPEQWAAVIEDFTHTCGATASSFQLVDFRYPEISNMVNKYAIEHEYGEEYNQRFLQDDYDAWLRFATEPPLRWISDEEAYQMPSTEIPSNNFQREYMGLDRRVTMRLNRTPAWFNSMTLNYHAGRGNITEEEKATSFIFLRHIAQAAELSWPFALLNHRFQAVFTVLNHLQIGIIVTNAHGEIILNNNEADQILSDNNGISRSIDNKFCLASEELTHALNVKINEVCSVQGKETIVGLMTVPRRDSSTLWLLEVTPITDLEGNLDKDFKGAIIYIIDAVKKDVILTEGMQMLFNLSPAESSICQMVTEGVKSAEIAERRNVSIETVRSQIKGLFTKTQTSNQLDLVRLALKVNLPVEKKKTK